MMTSQLTRSKSSGITYNPVATLIDLQEASPQIVASIAYHPVATIIFLVQALHFQNTWPSKSPIAQRDAQSLPDDILRSHCYQSLHNSFASFDSVVCFDCVPKNRPANNVLLNISVNFILTSLRY